MTLIVSWIDKKGAHQCGDSRISVYDGQGVKYTDDHNKLICLCEGRILIGIAGSLGVAGEDVREFIQRVFPKCSDFQPEELEWFIEKFPATLASHLNSSMSKLEVELQGTKITVITFLHGEFRVSGIDVKNLTNNSLSIPSTEYRISSQVIHRGNDPFFVARGEVNVEKAFNMEVSNGTMYQHADVLRAIINKGTFNQIIGGRVFCQHKIFQSVMEKKINEIVSMGNLEDFRDQTHFIIEYAVKMGFDIAISNLSEDHKEGQSSVNWENKILKVNYNNIATGTVLLCDLLHEYGHIIDGMPEPGEEKSLAREVSAWLHGYEKLKEFDLIKYRKVFIDRWNYCMTSYYNYHKEKSNSK